MGIRSSTRQMNTDSQGSQMLMIMSDAVIWDKQKLRDK